MRNNYGGWRGGGGFGFSLFPPVIKTLIIANVAVFLLDTFILSYLTVSGIRLDRLVVEFFALQPLDSGVFYPWQLISYQFMHRDFFHIFLNLLALWMFGVELENNWGARRFTVFYLLCGVGAGLIQLATQFLPFMDAAPTIGASGAVMGVLLAFGFMFPDRPVMMFPIFFPIPAKLFVIIYAGISFVSALLSPRSDVAHFAHLGGAFFGYMLFKHGDDLRIFAFFDKVFDTLSGRGRKNLRVVKGGRRSEAGSISGAVVLPNGQIVTETEVNEILDKISRTGFHSLSEQEKSILQAVSRKLD